MWFTSSKDIYSDNMVMRQYQDFTVLHSLIIDLLSVLTVSSPFYSASWPQLCHCCSNAHTYVYHIGGTERRNACLYWEILRWRLFESLPVEFLYVYCEAAFNSTFCTPQEEEAVMKTSHTSLPTFWIWIALKRGVMPLQYSYKLVGAHRIGQE